ncbi:hypothetical protein [Acinetobacter junii]|uniref:hypothetical protein n=1 Tax=Acinetobacter junii TaxID=40215 RepID=UPI001250AB45|nr:hypothetical protein [Acinetobacter junii]
MSNIKAVKLIIENIQYLEQAKTLLEEEISYELLVAVDTIVQEHIYGLENWDGTFDLNGSCLLQFAPKSWKAKQGDEFKYQNFYARYNLDCESSIIGGDSNYWWLSTFIKNDVERIVFRFSPYYDNYREQVNKTKWSKFANEQNQLIPQIEQEGLKFNALNGFWYLIVDGIEPKNVIEGFENNDLVEALTPITDALDILEQAHPYFDKIVQAAIARFGRVEEETV